MYAIIRRYTPDVVESGVNECLADITGLRTFFKMSYKELAQTMLDEIARELGVPFAMRVGNEEEFVALQVKSKRAKKLQSISTYKEMNTLFQSPSISTRKITIHKTKKQALNIPFLGKVR